MTAPQIAVTSAPADPRPVEELWSWLSPDFLAAIGWTEERRVISFPQTHPVLGWQVCAVINCEQQTTGVKAFCCHCTRHWTKQGRPDISRFAAQPRSRIANRDVENCVVDDCQRPRRSNTNGLCTAHFTFWAKQTGRQNLEEFLARADVVGHASLGPCEVLSCHRDKDSTRRAYCRLHAQRWTGLTVAQRGEIDELRWRRTTRGIIFGSEISMRSLPERVVAELLVGLDQRVQSGSRCTTTRFRRVVDWVRAADVASIEDLDAESAPREISHVIGAMTRSLRLLGLNPETERLKDVWQVAAFGLTGSLNFTVISQPWLREVTKVWTYNELPQRRGQQVRNVVQNYLRNMAYLSESLRLNRSDGGDDPMMLVRADIVAFLNRLTYLQNTGRFSVHKRIDVVVSVRKVLRAARQLGLARRGEPMFGMPVSFDFLDGDVPARPDDIEAGKDLPVEVMRHLCSHLDALEEANFRELRVAVELMIDTGRRPHEVCQLKLDCLERDEQGKPVLIYDNFKSNRPGRRLPILEPTAALIIDQQQRVQARFPNEPVAQLVLLPATTRNPHGRRSITDGWVSGRHRLWIDSLPGSTFPVVVEVDGVRANVEMPFDKERIFPYAYRHTYAQRHADAGVGIDVLRELMDHLRMETTQTYYRVGQKRRRQAVERVTGMQFDRHGNRVWRQAQAMLDSEHLRRAIGEVAVPYGSCSEPTNVSAGGGDCPVRFRCVGCSHFSTDISYLPDLESYLADLLRNRERLRSAFDVADDWARAESMPSDEEITRVRQLIARIRADVGDLDPQDRAQVQDAVDVVRRARNGVVGLGLPRTRQPLPDIRPDRSA